MNKRKLFIIILIPFFMRVPEVELVLEELVDSLKENWPLLREVRVFGSYHNGNWDPERSDVDIYVLIGGSNAAEYSTRDIFKNLQAPRNNKFELHIYTPWSAPTSINMGRGDMKTNREAGRLLYRKGFLYSLSDFLNKKIDSARASINFSQSLMLKPLKKYL